LKATAAFLAVLMPMTAPAATFSPTGTLPIVHISTEDAAPIVDKVTPVPGEMIVEDTDGTLSEPMSLTIRGRGNSSWKYSIKKPYKVKFTEKQPLLGMARSRHFAIMKFDDTFASYIGQEAMRRLGAPWAAHMVPVEVVLNGRYDALYYMSETVRVATNRVNITKQDDGETDPDIIPYGWLVEIDNYYSPYQISVKVPQSSPFMLTFHSPENVSAEQRQWIANEFDGLIDALYNEGEGKWTEKIDITSVARYFIVREVFHDVDGYHGSLYLYRDRDKWHFGPIWDVSLTQPQNDWILYDHPAYETTRLIEPIMDTPAFWEEVGRLWPKFRDEDLPYLYGEIDRMAELMAAADEMNVKRWDFPNTMPTAEKAAMTKQALASVAEWMDNEIRQRLALDETAAEPVAAPEYYDLHGRRVTAPGAGLYIERRGKNVRKVVKH